MRRVQLGIIGCGVIGSAHLKAAAASERITLAAVADLREEVARQAADQYDIPKVYTDGRELLADDKIEAVVLAMPAKGKAQLAIEAFKRGKHVLTEKPVALSTNEVEQMIAAQGSLVGACCSSRHSFLRSAEVARDIVEAGRLGPVRTVYCRILTPGGPPPKKTPPVWRLSKTIQGGGILVNWGCYDLDYLLGIMGWSLKPQSVFALTWPAAPQHLAYLPDGSDAETHYTAMVRCEDDILLHVERGEMTSLSGEASWQIIGDRGSLRLDMLPGAGKHVILDEWTEQSGVVSRVIDEHAHTWEDVHSGPVQDFAAAILDGGQPKTSLANARVVQQITDAIYASADKGAAVTL